MKALLLLAVLFATVVPGALAGTAARDGEVRAVSVLPAAGKVEIVIDLQGAAVVQDFTLANPARLVIDLKGTHLTAPVTLYDGQNRGGVRNIRYGQFTPDIVRVVIELDALKDYQVEKASGQVLVRIGTERTAFAAWSSTTVPTAAVAARAQARERMDAGAAPMETTAELGQPARITTPTPEQPMSIDEYLARHRADSTVPIETRLVRINYAKATSLVPSIASILTKRGAAVADSTSNALVITEVSSRIDEVVEFVKGLDQRTPQVSIQAKIIFVDRTDVEELGVKYDLGTTNQFFNQLVQRPDPRTAQPVDTDLDGVPDALVPTSTFPANQNIV